MELSKERKIKIYRGALKVLKNQLKKPISHRDGICFSIYTKLSFEEKIKIEDNIIISMRSMFSEVWKYEPKTFEKYGTHWFPLTDEGIKKRIEILETVIKELTK